MLLAHATWPEVEAYLGKSDGIIIPLGSIEQHGPIGLATGGGGGGIWLVVSKVGLPNTEESSWPG